ncbi:MAG: AAA family ATPase [Pirellulales bacterium]|nr:AAA family ATPase [Pirellulales bacterium]
MYSDTIGYQRRPFSALPMADHYFPAATIEAARNNLARCIERGEGPGLVIGPSGSGKTLLCLMLAEHFRELFLTVVLSCGRLGTRRALFQAILYELGRPYRGMDEGELRLALIDYLNRGEDNPNGMLLLVDEAQTLPMRLLEEIRLLSNLARDGRPLVRLVLAGAAALEERFANPRLDSFSQRLGARCYLEAFNRTETRQYIQSRLDSTGVSGEEVFPEDACASVHQATDGMPRLINQVCDHALLLAYVEGRGSISSADVDEAWADLQQLPAPRGAEPSGGRADGGVIEFGSLDESAESAEDHSVAAAFRVASAEDDENNDAEPAGQIHRIERLLAEADEDFQPAGSIGPEVELDFREQIHPFQEKFEEEEVVSDRYAAARERQPLTFGTSAYAIEYDPPAESSVSPNVCIAEGPEPASEQNTVVGETPAASAENTARFEETRRREYRHLFSQLRRG